MNNQRISIGIPDTFTAMIAEASMQLPPLTKPEQFELLKEFLAMTMEAFWQRYAAGCSDEARDALVAAVEKDDIPAIAAWYDAHANFERDAACADRAEKILDELAANLPDLMKQAFQEEFSAA